MGNAEWGMRNRQRRELQRAAAMSDFLPTAGWPALRLRAELLRRTRRFFDDLGFVEVETPIVSADVVVDRHLDPLVTEFVPLAGHATGRRTLYLQTSLSLA